MTTLLKGEVQDKLIDPDSALFRNLTLYSSDSECCYQLCGEINARNRMGGYVGYRQFYTFGFIDHGVLVKGASGARIDEIDEDMPDGGRPHQKFLRRYAETCHDGPLTP